MGTCIGTISPFSLGRFSLVHVAIGDYLLIMLQRYNKKLKRYNCCQRILLFHKPCEPFLFVRVLGNIYLCAGFIEIKDYLELNKKEEKHEEKKDFNGFSQVFYASFISYNGNVRIVHRQCTNGTWLMYEKESPSPTLPQGKGAFGDCESQIVNRLIV